jgi:chromosome partitioning protein
VTEPDDAAARGRAIFQRLRADQPDTSSEPADHDPQAPSATSAVVDDGHAVEESPHQDDAGRDLVRNPLPGLDDLSVVGALLDAGPGEPSDRGAGVMGSADEAEVVPAVPSDVPDGRPDADGAEAEEVAGAVMVDGGPGPSPLSSDLVDAPIVDAVDAPTDTVPGPAPLGSFARDLPRVMAVANQKGGVGKTTTAVNLGACLADIGYRVLVVDLDPQGNASTGLGINIRDLQGSMYDVILHDLPIEDCVEATSVKNLFCAPSSLDLAGAEIELVPAFSRELRLKRALEDVHDDYDFVLIDCPPSLGLLTVNGLAAATEVVVPIQCEYYALEGLGQLLRNVNLVQRNLNPGLEVSAIILVMYDARTKLADQVVNEVREHFGAKVCRNVVPRTVRLSEAPSFGQPIIAFDASSRGAIAYRELAKEVSGGTPQRAR